MWLAGGAVVVATLAVWSYVLFDRPVAWWAHRDLSARVEEFFNRITPLAASESWLLWSAVAVVVCLVLRFPKRAWDAALVFCAVAGAGLLVNAIKGIFARVRPEGLLLHHLYGFEFFHTNYALVSFPSGHAATAGALGMTLTLLAPRLWPIWWLAALLLAASRVMLTAHYVSDALVGLYLGAAVALLLNGLWNQLGGLEQQSDST